MQETAGLSSARRGPQTAAGFGRRQLLFSEVRIADDAATRSEPANSAKFSGVRRMPSPRISTIRKSRPRRSETLGPYRDLGSLDEEGYCSSAAARGHDRDRGQNVHAAEIEEILLRHPASPNVRCSDCPTISGRARHGLVIRKQRRPHARNSKSFAATSRRFKTPNNSLSRPMPAAHTTARCRNSC